MPRPRIHPEGTTASDRAAAATRRLEAAGGARKTFALSPEAVAALAAIRAARGDANDTALIERLLADERRRLARHGS